MLWPGCPGLVGIIPALGMMTEAENPGGPLTLSVGQLLLWSFALVRQPANPTLNKRHLEESRTSPTHALAETSRR